MEALTQEVYSAEFSRGKVFDNYGGKPVREARDDVAALMMERYGSIPMYEFDNRQVICRCGGRVFVKILHDQWFLEYSDPCWKEQVKTQLERMALVPPEVRTEFVRTVDWLKDWACTRRVGGLGTKLPWDPTWIIEPLSDSTIYMAYYTIAHHLKAIPPEDLTPEVFEYIFFGGEGNPETVDRETLDRLRNEFLYWYPPYDYRFSAKDLISNHLTFQLFHHRAIFPQELQPQGMVVFGMGLLNGAKMSSSKGNVFLLEDAVEEFGGADTVRMFLVGSAEPGRTSTGGTNSSRRRGSRSSGSGTRLRRQKKRRAPTISTPGSRAGSRSASRAPPWRSISSRPGRRCRRRSSVWRPT